MNTSMIRYILGTVLKLEAVLMLLPCIVALIYRESGILYFLITIAISLAAGFLLSAKKPQDNLFYLKEGCVATALSWVVLSVAGCLPFCLSGEIPSFTDALFETISGFTTTGSSILTDVEALSYCMLFWRSFTHWVGGMGVLVFLLAIIPMSGGSHFNLMRAESPGPTVGKLVPKLASTAQILYIIYFCLTLIETILLFIAGMPLFDSITTALGTAGTGGFGIKGDSIAGYSALIQWIVTIFMILFGVNFNAYYILIFGSIKDALKSEEVRWYFLIIACATLFITINILGTVGNVFDSLTQAAFQVGSIITTTGFATADFNLWPEASKGVLVMLMFCGACAGSTGGGIKVSRCVIAAKTVKKELGTYAHPKSIRQIKFEGKTVGHDVVHSIHVYFIAFILIYCASVFLVSLEGKDFTTNFTAVAATINNIGPGLEIVGPTGNFSSFSILSKYVLMFDMLAGRLELFPMLILFYPPLWKDTLHERKQRRKRLNAMAQK